MSPKARTLTPCGVTDAIRTLLVSGGRSAGWISLQVAGSTGKYIAQRDGPMKTLFQLHRTNAQLLKSIL